jgi:hypothetical protein
VDKIFDLLLKKYNIMLSDLQNGYPINKSEIKELLDLLHVLHFVSSEHSFNKESLKILAYYE